MHIISLTRWSKVEVVESLYCCGIWFDTILQINQKAAESLADPEKYPNLFEEWQVALAVEAKVAETRYFNFNFLNLLLISTYCVNVYAWCRTLVSGKISPIAIGEYVKILNTILGGYVVYLQLFFFPCCYWGLSPFLCLSLGLHGVTWYVTWNAWSSVI